MRSNYLDLQASKEQLLEDSKNEIWIKRDDLIHPIVSGNKWRKLKYLVAKIKEQGIETVITFGGAYSNHILATACVCAQEGLSCKLVIRGEEPKLLNHYLLMCKSFGASLHFVSRSIYKEEKQSLDYLGFSNTPKSIVISEGGEHHLAYLGCQDIIGELNQNYDFIFTASGTGTTAIGLAQALQRSNTKLVVVPVLKNELEIEEKLKDFNCTEVLHNAHQGGYAKTNMAVFNCIEQVLQEHGILLDPIYTAKSYLAMRSYMIDKENKKALFLHTGGSFGLFSDIMQKKWAQSQLGKMK